MIIFNLCLAFVAAYRHNLDTSSPCLKRCSRIFQPVCASNGVTYTNDCLLNNLMCFGKVDASITFVEGQCECPKECDANNQPVCGSDSATYYNECALKFTACNQINSVLSKANDGPCLE